MQASRRIASACLAAALWACASPPDRPEPSRPGAAPACDASAPAHADARAEATWEPPFLVRGRLDDASDVTWRTRGGDGPVDGTTLQAAASAASAAWRSAGGVALREARPDEAPDVEISWRTDRDDPCGLFGSDASIAHTGPMALPTFVHLDAGRAWTLDDAAAGERLDAALAHEFGHVLGLDHSPDPGALMAFDGRRAAPAAQDLAGVHSLYGGGSDAPGDVLVLDGAASSEHARRTGPALRAIAPPDRTALALLDVDGDGADELLVWRTDRAGIGALTVHHFVAGDDGPLLERTDGPWLDVVPPGAVTSLRVDASGRRWLVVREGDDQRVRGFDEAGRLRAPAVEELLALDVGGLLAAPAPGVIARSEGGLGPPHATDGAEVDALLGDLDGDGRDELLRRVERGPLASASATFPSSRIAPDDAFANGSSPGSPPRPVRHAGAD